MKEKKIIDIIVLTKISQHLKKQNYNNILLMMKIKNLNIEITSYNFYKIMHD